MSVPVLLAGGLYLGHLAGYGETVPGTVRRLLAAGWQATAGRILLDPTPVAPPPSRPVLWYEGELAAPVKRPHHRRPGVHPRPGTVKGPEGPGTIRSPERPGTADMPRRPGRPEVADAQGADGGTGRRPGKAEDVERRGRTPAATRPGGRPERAKAREKARKSPVPPEAECPAEWRESWLWERCQERMREGPGKPNSDR